MPFQPLVETNPDYNIEGIGHKQRLHKTYFSYLVECSINANHDMRKMPKSRKTAFGKGQNFVIFGNSSKSMMRALGSIAHPPALCKAGKCNPNFLRRI